eukprot:GFYU01004797.1.p1 GENE.GFYU01004797.1~~GFYU01004797.1.p1  ORF type:complete len:172 (-),score=13.30 GFYU01004797.1:77-592(-)
MCQGTDHLNLPLGSYTATEIPEACQCRATKLPLAATASNSSPPLTHSTQGVDQAGAPSSGFTATDRNRVESTESGLVPELEPESSLRCERKSSFVNWWLNGDSLDEGAVPFIESTVGCQDNDTDLVAVSGFVTHDWDSVTSVSSSKHHGSDLITTSEFDCEEGVEEESVIG